MVLRPLLITRVANTVPGTAVVVVGGLYFSSEGPPLAGAAGLVGSVVVGAILAYRGFRLGIDCSDDPVVVHGLLRNRKIRRKAVVTVTGFPALRWRDEHDRLRWTPIIAFAEAGAVIPTVARHNEASIERLSHLLRS